jgi:hypothetical protein
MAQSSEICLWTIQGTMHLSMTMIVKSQGSNATDGQAGQLASG